MRFFQLNVHREVTSLFSILDLAREEGIDALFLSELPSKRGCQSMPPWRPVMCGLAAIYCKSSLTVVTGNLSYHNTAVAYVGDLCVVSVYFSPNCRNNRNYFEQSMHDLDVVVSEAMNRTNKVIIAGDFNCHLGEFNVKSDRREREY